jgi:hypothetical protein
VRAGENNDLPASVTKDRQKRPSGVERKNSGAGSLRGMDYEQVISHG